MVKIPSIYKILYVMFLILSLSSCTEEKYDGEYLDNSPVVIAIYQPNGMGDLGYNDAVYSGVQQAAKEIGLRTYNIEPSTYESGIATIKSMLAMQEEGVKYLYVVLADAGYDDFLTHYGDSIPDNEFSTILMLGKREASNKTHTLCLPYYGIFYEAGAMARKMDDVKNILIISADSTMSSLESAREGFIEGYKPESGKNINTVYLNDKINGFNMADKLYEYAYEADDTFDLVVPICGGSCQGLYRYNREHRESFYTLGIDADMCLYSPLVPFSCVRHFDRAIYDCIKLWNTDILPRSQSLGISSGYVETIIAPDYYEQFAGVYDSIHTKAIAKEKEYEK